MQVSQIRTRILACNICFNYTEPFLALSRFLVFRLKLEYFIQFTEIKQLQNVIEQLEKKLGFEAGTCLRLQMEKDALDEALARLKQADSWDKRSSKSVKGTDFNGLEFDIEGLIMELPVRLVCFIFPFIHFFSIYC